MLKIISSYIRAYAIVLADKALLKMCEQALSLLDPQKQKAKDIKDIITYVEGKPDVSRVKNFLKTGLDTVNHRISGMKRNVGESALKVVGLFNDYKKLFSEAVAAVDKAGTSPEERNKFLNIAAKNTFLIKDGLEQNKALIQKAQMGK